MTFGPWYDFGLTYDLRGYFSYLGLVETFQGLHHGLLGFWALQQNGSDEFNANHGIMAKMRK